MLNGRLYFPCCGIVTLPRLMGRDRLSPEVAADASPLWWPHLTQLTRSIINIWLLFPPLKSLKRLKSLECLFSLTFVLFYKWHSRIRCASLNA